MRYCIIVASLLLALTLFADRRSMLFSRVPTAAGGGGDGSPAVESWGLTNNTFVSLRFQTNSVTVAGANKLLLFFIGIGVSSQNQTTNVSYGGVNLTKLWATNGPSWVVNECWYLLNPSSGTASIIVEGATGYTADQMCHWWVNVTNVNQSTPVGTVVTASGTSTGPSVTVAGATGDLIISGLSTDSGATLTASTGSFVTNKLNVGSDTAYASTTNAGGASVAMSFTTASEHWALGGVAIKKP